MRELDKNKDIDKNSKEIQKLRKRITKQAKKLNMQMTDAEEAELIKEQLEIKELTNKITILTTLKQLWYLLSGTRKRIPVLFILMLGNSLINLIGTSLIIPFVLFLQNSQLINTANDISQYGFLKRMIVLFSRYIYDVFNFTNANQVVIFFGIAFVLVFVIRTILSLFVAYMMSLYTAYATKNLAEKIYTVILHMSYTYYLGRSSAQTMFAMGLSGRSFGVIIAFLNLINDSFMIVALGGGVILWSPNILLVILAVFVVGAGTYLLTHRELRRIAETELVLSKQSSVSMYQGVHNFTFSRLLGAESFFLRIFNALYNKTIPLGAYKNIITSLPRIVLEVCMTVFFVMYTIYVIIKTPERSDEVIATAAVIAAAIFKLMPASLRITGFFGHLAGNQVAVNEFYEEYTTALHHRVDPVTDDIEPLNFKDILEVKNVSFSYPIFDKKGRNKTYEDSPEILRDVSLSINKGDKIGIVGSSGGGKTTLMHVLMAFLEPLQGSVIVDGVDIHKNMRAWQKNIGYVPQDILLTEGTVLDNIAFGISPESIDVKKVEEVLKTALLWDVIKTMPQGLKTLIGDAGKRLSGGQRQRLGIARALYRSPTILFFDEATSHLDVNTEKEVQKAIDNLPQETTVVIIAHRLNTLASCNKIYAIDYGQITFSGDYENMCKHLETRG